MQIYRKSKVILYSIALLFCATSTYAIKAFVKNNISMEIDDINKNTKHPIKQAPYPMENNIYSEIVKSNEQMRGTRPIQAKNRYAQLISLIEAYRDNRDENSSNTEQFWRELMLFDDDLRDMAKKESGPEREALLSIYAKLSRIPLFKKNIQFDFIFPYFLLARGHLLDSENYGINLAISDWYLRRKCEQSEVLYLISQDGSCNEVKRPHHRDDGYYSKMAGIYLTKCIKSAKYPIEAIYLAKMLVKNKENIQALATVLTDVYEKYGNGKLFIYSHDSFKRIVAGESVNLTENREGAYEKYNSLVDNCFGENDAPAIGYGMEGGVDGEIRIFLKHFEELSGKIGLSYTQSFLSGSLWGLPWLALDSSSSGFSDEALFSCLDLGRKIDNSLFIDSNKHHNIQNRRIADFYNAYAELLAFHHRAINKPGIPVEAIWAVCCANHWFPDDAESAVRISSWIFDSEAKHGFQLPISRGIASSLLKMHYSGVLPSYGYLALYGHNGVNGIYKAFLLRNFFDRLKETPRFNDYYASAPNAGFPIGTVKEILDCDTKDFLANWHIERYMSDRDKDILGWSINDSVMLNEIKATKSIAFLSADYDSIVDMNSSSKSPETLSVPNSFTAEIDNHDGENEFPSMRMFFKDNVGDPAEGAKQSIGGRCAAATIDERCITTIATDPSLESKEKHLLLYRSFVNCGEPQKALEHLLKYAKIIGRHVFLDAGLVVAKKGACELADLAEQAILFCAASNCQGTDIMRKDIIQQNLDM